MAKREQLEFEATFTDRASQQVGELADTVEKLDGRTADVTIEADDRASDEIATLRQRLGTLTAAEYSAILNADARKLRNEINRANRALALVDGEEAEAIIAAKDEASRKLEAVEGELREIDRYEADATVDAIDRATAKIKGAQDAGEDFDNDTYTATADVTDGGGLDNILAKLGNAPGGLESVASSLTSPGGALTALGGALFGAGLHAANIAIEADNIANFTNTSVTEAGRLATVLRDQTSIESQDLLDIIAQMRGTLEANPELVEQFGLSLDQVREDPLTAFVQVVDQLAADGKLTGDELTAAMALFGEEGVRQVNEIIGVVGPDGLRGEMEAISENRLVHDEDVDNARDFRRQWAQVAGQFQGLALTLGQEVLPVLLDIADAAAPFFDMLDTTHDFEMGDTIFEWMQKFPSEKFVDLNDRFLELGGTVESLRENFFHLSEVQALVEAGVPLEVIATAKMTGQALDYLAEQLGESEEAATALKDALEDGSVSQEEWRRITADGVVTMDEVRAAITDTTDQVEDNTEATEENTEANEVNADSLEDRREAIEEAIEAAERLARVDREGADGVLDAREATRRAADALDDYNEAKREGRREGETAAQYERRLNAALDGVVRSADRVADAYVDKTRRAREARGMTLNEVEANRLHSLSLLNQARTMNGPARTALLQHIARINGIPQRRITQILTDANPNDLRQVEREINWAARNRYGTVYMNTVLRHPVIRAHISGGGGTVNIGRLRATAGATGIPSVPGGETLLVGEEGPELVELPAGSRITNSRRTGELARAGGLRGSRPSVVNNYFTTVNVPRGTDARAVLKGERRYARIQGPA